MILRCISDVPPAIVDETVLRYAVPCRPRIGAFSPRSCPYRARQVIESGSPIAWPGETNSGDSARAVLE